MADKRMFTQKIVDSDAFLDMPLSAQSLYFHLNMRADDDGFINSPKKIQRMIGASDDDLKLLIAKRFMLAFDNGIVVIKHWRLHNTIRKDRYSPTQYQEQLQEITTKSNGAYTERQPNGNHLATICQPSDNQADTSQQPADDQDELTIHGESQEYDQHNKLGNQMATTWQPSDNHLTTNPQPVNIKPAAQYSIDKYSIDKYRSAAAAAVSNSNLDSKASETDSAATAYKSFEDEFGRPLTPAELDKIKDWLCDDKIPTELILYGLQLAVLRNRRSMRYIDTVLQSWSDSGVRTVSEANEQYKKYKKQTEKSGGKNKIFRGDQEDVFADEIYEVF